MYSNLASAQIVSRTTTRDFPNSKPFKLFFCGLWLAASGMPALAQAPKIRITDPLVKPGTVLLAQGAVDLNFKVNDEDVTRVRVIVTTNVDATREDVDIDPTEQQTVTVGLFKGINKIQLIGIKDGEPDPRITTSITVTCSGPKCGGAVNTKVNEGVGERPQKTGKVPEEATRKTKGPQAEKSAVTISGTDELPQDVEDWQVAYTKTDSSVEYLLVIEPRTKLLRHIAEIKTNMTVADTITLKDGTSTIRVLAFDANNKKLGPDITKDVVAHITGKNEAVILGDPFQTDSSDVKLHVKLIDPHKVLTQLRFKVSGPNGLPVDEGQQAVKPDEDFQQIDLRVGAGTNRVMVAAFKDDGTKAAENKTTIECAGTCGGPSSKRPSIKLEEPFKVSHVGDSPLLITPQDGERISDYYYIVRDEQGQIVTDKDVPAVKGADGKPAAQSITVLLTEGRNTISVVGRNENKEHITETVTTVITCSSCNETSAQSGSSVFTRAILGFEQSGGSASDSAQKPFLDFFFGAPISGRRSDIVPPRFATWGNVRFASVPQQQLASGGLQNFASGFLTNVQQLKVNELVQGFDFLAGMDVRLIPPKGRGFVDLDPGTRQNTSVSFVVGFGAINPFTQRQVAQIFAIPKTADGSIDPEFLKLFPEATGKTNIAFVTPERDRFFRQYYGGFRFKTFFYDRHGAIINRFPATLDVTFGQNELVTGKLRNAVLRLEGFYPFPFRSARFLYLYGTVMMKIGGGGVKTNLPIFLKPPATTVTLPDDNTVIVPIDRNPTLRSTRDYYRFGLGINLIELLDKLKSRPQ